MKMDTCRFCNSLLKETFVDLGASPLANAYLKAEDLAQHETFYPLHARVCGECFLVQLPEIVPPDDIFTDYAYFSSYSDSWLEHAKFYTQLMIKRFGFNAEQQVVEIASNDGYLLRFFKEQGIPILGIEPALNVAKVAEASGIPTITEFFGVETAKKLLQKGGAADLLIANNVLAHVPDINDFVSGMKILLSSKGIITVEFPHLLRLISENQFDTIYHEHYSYLSLITVSRIFLSHGLRIFDVDELESHGGSLRIYACHDQDSIKKSSQRVFDLTVKEKNFGIDRIEMYQSFSSTVKHVKRNILEFMISAKNDNRSLAGYGAPAKGNTLLNYCGIKTDFLDYTVDRSPHKQGHHLPGTRIPIFHPDRITETKPDYVVILPWNIKEEIMLQMPYIREWNGKFVTLIPDVRIIE